MNDGLGYKSSDGFQDTFERLRAHTAMRRVTALEAMVPSLTRLSCGVHGPWLTKQPRVSKWLRPSDEVVCYSAQSQVQVVATGKRTDVALRMRESGVKRDRNQKPMLYEGQ